jgi:tetratricopeptide (TPR) repeat protein
MKALEHFERALAIDPNHLDSLTLFIVQHTVDIGRLEFVESLIPKLIKMDPLSAFSVYIQIHFPWMAGNFDQALAACQRGAEYLPELPWWHLMPMYIHAWKGEYKHAFENADHLVRQWPEDPITSMAITFRHALRGEKQDAVDALSDDAITFLWNDPECPWMGAAIYALLEDRDESLRWIEHWIRSGSINYPLLAEQAPFFENLRSDRRFKRLMEEIKPKWERYEPRIDLTLIDPASDAR